MLVFGQPHIESKEILEVVKTLKSGWLGTGPKVHKFEKLISNYKKIKNTVAVNSCTAALHLSLLAIKLRKNDEVILPSMTFAATANAVSLTGAKPVFADIDPFTFCMDPDFVNSLVKPYKKEVKRPQRKNKSGNVPKLSQQFN